MAEDQAAVEDRPELNVTVEDTGPARKLLTIEIPESRIKSKIEENYDGLSDGAALPGFRKGRAPRRLLERRFGSSVRDDTKGQLISECYGQAVEDEKLEVIGEPDVRDVEDIELPDSGALTFKVEIEVAPSVTLPDFAGLSVTREPVVVEDGDVNGEIERLADRFGTSAPAPDGKAKPGDYVQAEVRIFDGDAKAPETDDVVVEPLVHEPATYLFVPTKQMEGRGHVVGIVVDDLEKQLKGAATGDEIIITMAGPPGHENEKIRDRPIEIVIGVAAIVRHEPASLEKIVEQTGADSEDKLREDIRQSIEQQKTRQQQADMHRQVSDQLLEKVDLDLPEGLTGRQVERVLSRERMEMMYRSVPEQEIDQKIAEMRSSSEDEARRQLKLFFIVDQAAKDLDISVSENEINSRVYMLALQQRRRPEKLRQQMRQRGDLEQLYLQLREQKTLDHIVSQAKVSEAAAPAAAPAAGKKKSSKRGKKKKKSE